MINRIARNFNHRFPLYGENHERIGTITLAAGSVVAVFAGISAVKSWRRKVIESREIEKYRAVDPDQVVPKVKDLHQINLAKLMKAVNEGGDKFIHDELIDRLMSSPEEFIYINTSEITPKDRESYLSFLREKIKALE